MANSVEIGSLSWGDFGKMMFRFAECGELDALKLMAPDFAKGMAAAEALKAIQPTLNEDQRATMARTLAAELTKQGF